MFETFEVMRGLLAEYEKARAYMAEVAARIDCVFCIWLTDLSLLPQLYEWYVIIAERDGFCGDAAYGNNKQFLLVVLMLYSPKSLCGGRIDSGLRRAVASLLGMRSDTFIYRMRDKAVSWNEIYRRFSGETAAAYHEIADRLLEDDLV